MTEFSAVVAGLRRRVPGLLEKHRLPGLAIGICDADSVLWSAGFGSTRAGGEVPVGTSTMFSVQSCSKMYTATAVLLAVQDGLVDLDEPIPRYLPEFRVNSAFEDRPERRITLRHLLGHTAGFTHEAPVGSNYRIGSESFEAHCRSISDTWLRFPVGHHYQYSNLGIDLAGYILQRRTGLPFHEFVRRSLFGPLALDRTSFDARVFMREADRAIGHSTGSRRLPVQVPMVAAGGLYTSVDDACRYLQFHIAGGSLLSPELFAEMYRGDQGYGLGIALTRANDVPVRGHGGGGFGFLSDMYWAPAAGPGVVVLTNSTSHPLQWKLASEVLRELVGNGTPRRHGPPARRSVPAAALCGDYIDSDQVSFVVEAGEAFLVSGGARKRAEFVSHHEFWVEDQLYRFRDLDADGHPAYLERVEDGHVRYRNDVPKPVPEPGPEPAPAGPGGPWNRDYAIRASGVREGTARLRVENGVHLLDHWSGSTLRLREHRPNLYISSTGEALDLTRTPPTYANVQLHQLSSRLR